MNDLTDLIKRASSLMTRLEYLLPPTDESPDWSASAFCWRRKLWHGRMVAVEFIDNITLDNLLGIDEQKARLEQNTRQFLAGYPANNALLTGARGTGKSSLVKAVFNACAAEGLRLVEVERSHLADLPEIISLLDKRQERFILFCDDLSFVPGDTGDQALKSVLDGSINALPDNVLIYATSNRRHLMPELMSENLELQRSEFGEIHPGETTEEKISFSDRFGLWLSFHTVDQEAYLAICAHWLQHYGVKKEAVAAAYSEALRWALQRGSRCGRTAWHFARDYCGRNKCGHLNPDG